MFLRSGFKRLMEFLVGSSSGNGQVGKYYIARFSQSTVVIGVAPSMFNELNLVTSWSHCIHSKYFHFSVV